MGDVRWPRSRRKSTVNRYVTSFLVILFLPCLVSGQSGLEPLRPGRAIANYKIVPKPCKVKSVEGTCMFVWECMKTDGKAIGMCVDGFMFGSCCVHSNEHNLIDSTRDKNGTFETYPTAGTNIINVIQSATTASSVSNPTTAKPVSATSKPAVKLALTTLGDTEAKPVLVTSKPADKLALTTTPDNTTVLTELGSKWVQSGNKLVAATIQPDNEPDSTASTQRSKPLTVTAPFKVLGNEPLAVTSIPDRSPVSSTKPVPAGSGKPVVLSSSVTVIGLSSEFVPKNSSSSGSASAVIQGSGFHSVGNGQQVKLGSATGSADKRNTTAVSSSTFSISSDKAPIAVPSSEFLPEGLIIQKVTKQKRPSPSSARPTTTTSATTTTKQLTISASPSGEKETESTTKTKVSFFPTPGLNRPFAGVDIESTLLSLSDHSVDAQYFVVSSTSSMAESNKTQAPSTGLPIRPPTTPDTTPIDAVDTTEVVTGSSLDLVTAMIDFPEYMLHVTHAPNKVNKRCGTQNPMPKVPTTRVVGGSSTVYGSWPWQASVRRTSFFGFSSTHRCGGTLLNEQWVITAAHCVEDLLLTQLRVRLGEYDVASLTEAFPVVERSVSKKVVHPKYNFFTYENDIAILRLEEPVELSPTISPICLPASDDLLVGMNATVTGWGRLSEGGTLPNILQQVTLPIISNEKCKSMFLKSGRHEFIPEIFLCAGYEEGGRDACQGDSGGPLQIKARDGQYFLAGIISWGIGCAEPNLPGVCTRISKFTNWILENVSS